MGAKPNGEVVADILTAIKERRSLIEQNPRGMHPMTSYMKIVAGRFVVPVLALLVMVVSIANCLGGPESAQTNAPVETTMDRAKDTVKDAVAEGKDAVREESKKPIWP